MSDSKDSKIRHHKAMAHVLSRGLGMQMFAALVFSLIVGAFITGYFLFSETVVVGTAGSWETRSVHGFPLRWLTTGFEIFWVNSLNLLLDVFFWSLVTLSTILCLFWTYPRLYGFWKKKMK